MCNMCNNHSYQILGKRVAVIGTGASAVQVRTNKETVFSEFFDRDCYFLLSRGFSAKF